MMATKRKVVPLLDRIPPYSEEGEKGVLCSMLIDPECRARALEVLQEDDFYIPATKICYNEFRSQWENGKQIDLILFTQHLKDSNLLDEIGGPGVIAELFTFVPTAASIHHYIEIVKDKASLRTLILKSTEAVRRAHEEQHETADIIATTQLDIATIKKFNLVPRKKLSDYVSEKIERMENGEPDGDIIFTKIRELDILSPLRQGDMPIITGHRKDGKSIFALSILENICISQKRPGVYFSLEDRTPKVVNRLLAGVSRIPMNRHHVKHLTDDEVKKCLEAAGKIAKADLLIHDDAFDLSTIIAKFKAEIVEHPTLAVGVIDYAQLIRVHVKKSDSREREVATISRAFRQLSMETGVPILLISQLNSDGETRESRALEQDCTASWKIKQDEDGDQTKRYISIEFQRNGESGVGFPVRFLGSIGRVENPAPLEIIKNGAQQ